MTKDNFEFSDGGFLRDRYGRRELLARTKHQALNPGDALVAGTVIDTDGREQVVFVDGPPGTQGAQGPPGIGANWKGTWSAIVTYVVGDGVSRNGIPFISNQAGNLNHDPALDTTFVWWTPVYAPTFINVRYPPYNAKGDGVTDDTVAIQTALDAAGTAGGGTVYFPDGNYLVGGALQTTGSYCTQLKLPLLGSAKTIRLLGDRRANIFGDSPGPGNGVIITSTSAGALYATNSKLPSVIGGPASTNPFTTTSNSARVEIQNIAIKVPANPRITGIDTGAFYQAQFVGVQVYSGGYPIAVTANNKEGIGIVLPYLNNYDSNILDSVTIVGLYNGLVVGEHTSAPMVHIDSCLIGVSWWPMAYSAWFGMLDLERCKHGFAFSNFAVAGGPANGDTTNPGIITVSQLDLEQQTGGAWNDYSSTVNDTARNALYLRILNLNQNVDAFITITSGAHVFTSSLDAPSQQYTRAFRFSTNQSINSAVDTAITLASNTAPTTPSIGSFPVGTNNLLAWNNANPTRLTAPATGLYKIDAQASFAHFAGSMATYLTLKSNGGTTRALASGSGAIVTSSFETYLSVSYTAEMIADDYIEMFCYQNSGGALDILKDVTWMTMTRIG